MKLLKLLLEISDCKHLCGKLDTYTCFIMTTSQKGILLFAYVCFNELIICTSK